MTVSVICGILIFSDNHTQSICEMRFADPGRTEKHNVLCVFYKSHGSQFINLPLINGGLKRKIELPTIKLSRTKYTVLSTLPFI